MESVTDVIAEGPELRAVDLSEVEFMDAAGFNVLESTARHIDTQRMRLAVICPPDTEWQLLHVAGLHREAYLHESADEALRPWIEGEDDPSPDEKSRAR